MLPILPFLFLILGWQIVRTGNRFPRVTRLVAWILIIVDLVLFVHR